MGEIRKQFIYDDGRNAEKVEFEDQTCEGVKITEVYVEPKIEKKLAQRIIEKRRPMVYEREIETVDEASGDTIEKIVESMDNGPKLQIVERIATGTSVAAQSVEEGCSVTREELRQDIMDAVSALVKVLGMPKEEGVPQTVSVQSVLEEKIAQKNSNSGNMFNMGLLALIAVQAAGLAWILFGQQ